MIEFAATLLLPKTNVGGYVNTGWDLVCNLIGAVLAAGWIRWSAGRIVTTGTPRVTPAVTAADRPRPGHS